MNDQSSSISKEETLRLIEMRRSMQQYSYDLTQRLSFFVISVELIFCGYILLNSDKLGVVNFSSLIFLISGSAAVFGLVWRFCYNQTFHENAHGKKTNLYRICSKIQNYSYWLYVGLTLIFIVSVVAIGYEHINRIEKKRVSKENESIKYIERLSQQIDKIENGLNNIAVSIEKISKIEPKVEVNIKSPERDTGQKSNNTQE